MEYNLQTFKAGDVLTAEQLNRIEAALKQAMKSALPVKVDLIKLRAGEVAICVDGLTEGNTYAIQLYKKGRYNERGWDMLWDGEQSTAGFVPQIAGTLREKSPSTTEYFTSEVPEWMPNQGVLQTRWEFTADKPNKTELINTKIWILDYLKPNSNNWTAIDTALAENDDGTPLTGAKCTLIGAKQAKNNSAKFKVGILQLLPSGQYELVGFSEETLVLSGIRNSRIEDMTHSEIIVAMCLDSKDVLRVMASNLAVRIK